VFSNVSEEYRSRFTPVLPIVSHFLVGFWWARSGDFVIASDVLTHLQAQFPGQLVLYTPDLARVLGKSEKALAHIIARGQLPFAVKKLGGKHCVSIFHVAEWLAAAEEGSETPTAVDEPKTPVRRRRSGARSGIGARLMEMRLEAVRVLLSGDEFSSAVADDLASGAIDGEFVVRLRAWQKLGGRLVSSELRGALDDASEARAFIAWLQDQAAGCTYARITARQGRAERYLAQGFKPDGGWLVVLDRL
jgi:hypothetical protein